MHITAYCIISLSFSSLVNAISTHYDDSNDPNKERRAFRASLMERRAEHLGAVRRIMQMPERKKILSILGDKFLQVLTDARTTLEASGQPPDGNHFEMKESIEALGSLVTNIAFLGELLLRMPTLTHEYLKENRRLSSEVKWGVSFCNASGVLDPASDKMLNLMAQELEIIPKDPNYVNPYKENVPEEMYGTTRAGMTVDLPSKSETKKKKKPPIKKGPRMTRARDDL